MNRAVAMTLSRGISIYAAFLVAAFLLHTQQAAAFTSNSRSAVFIGSVAPAPRQKPFVLSSVSVRDGSNDASASSSSPEMESFDPPSDPQRVKRKIGVFAAKLAKIRMVLFIASMCIALPATLLPQQLLLRTRIISERRSQQWALATGQFCARWLFRLFPFARVSTTEMVTSSDPPKPSIWVCNHISMLDVFVLLAMDKRLRGSNKRPIKIVYWKDLEKNPVTKLLFRQCGFIPVQMAANEAGENNEYDLSSFKQLLKSTKKAFQEGFDIGILPEGQLNPAPEKGLLPCFPGAFTLAKMSKRPIAMMGLYGCHNMWHPHNGMDVVDNDIRIRNYGEDRRKFGSSDEFLATFSSVVGEFGKTGKDLPEPELSQWLTGSHPSLTSRDASQKKEEE